MKHQTVCALFLISLTGCGAQPAPEFLFAQRTDIVREGRSYTVYHTTDRVEVIRLGYARPRDQAAIRQTMTDVIPEVTGCTVVPTSLEGDSGEMRGAISC